MQQAPPSRWLTVDLTHLGHTHAPNGARTEKKKHVHENKSTKHMPRERGIERYIFSESVAVLVRRQRGHGTKRSQWRRKDNSGQDHEVQSGRQRNVVVIYRAIASSLHVYWRHPRAGGQLSLNLPYLLPPRRRSSAALELLHHSHTSE